MADGRDRLLESNDWWLLLPPQLRNLPADLGAVVVTVLLTNSILLLPVVRDTSLRIIVGGPFLLFAPGYALIAALFPAAADDRGAGNSGLRPVERTALSFGLSIVLVPLVGFALTFSPWGFGLVPILVALSSLTLGSTAVAARRRRELPIEDQFSVPYREWIRAGRAALVLPENRTEAMLNLILALTVLLAVSSVTYAVAAPKQDEPYTELYLLSRSQGGELIAADYPTDLTRGASTSLTVGIRNREHSTIEYSVVVELQRVDIADNTTTVLEEEELHRFETRLEHNETWRLSHAVTPTLTGQRLRLAYMLYRGAPPEDATVGSAYREVHLWVDVSESS